MKHDETDAPANMSRRAWMERTAYAITALSALPLLARCEKDAGGVSAAAAGPMLGGEGTMPKPLQLGMLLYPGFTLLDLTGPQGALGPHGQTHLVAKTLDPVMTDLGLPILPTTTFGDCPTQLDVLFVPGGFTADAMRDADTLRFLNDRAPHARYVTSVCTGALILAAAGLLNGYRAATHWAARDILALFDVEVVTDRVVIDRNRMTGGGVTAGIDFGLTLLSKLRDENTAQLTQLQLEYAPQPPYMTGSPEAAGPELVARVKNLLEKLNAQITQAAEEAIANMS